jgi:hypothetical protein
VTNTNAIATKLNVLESAIVRIEEWASVMFVVVKGLGARFVSKKVVAVKMEITIERIEQGVKLIGADGVGIASIESKYWESEGRKIGTGIHQNKMTTNQIAELRDRISAILSQPEPSKVVFKSRKSATSSLEFDMYNSNGRYYG